MIIRRELALLALTVTLYCSSAVGAESSVSAMTATLPSNTALQVQGVIPVKFRSAESYYQAPVQTPGSKIGAVAPVFFARLQRPSFQNSGGNAADVKHEAQPAFKVPLESSSSERPARQSGISNQFHEATPTRIVQDDDSRSKLHWTPLLLHSAFLFGTSVAQVEMSRRIPSEWLWGRYPSRAKMYGINFSIDSALTIWSCRRNVRSGRFRPQDIKSYVNLGLVMTEALVSRKESR